MLVWAKSSKDESFQSSVIIDLSEVVVEVATEVHKKEFRGHRTTNNLNWEFGLDIF